MSENFKKDAREFLQKNGEMVRYNNYGDVDYYGWKDHNSYEHCLTDDMRKLYEKHGEKIPSDCSWVIPEGSEVIEQTVSMFAGTFVDSEDEVLLIVKNVHCKCGKYRNVDLGWSGGVGELMRKLYSVNSTRFTL